jgi:hypothetical protein
MAESFNARRAAKDLLQGIAPPRPLFLPIAFSIGARIENLPLRSYLSNSTKIVNALRQIRTHLRSDGATCYFDPCLEAEALGATLDWDAAGQRPTLRWPASASAPPGELPENLRAPDELPKSGRVPVAVDVISRLRSLLRDDCLLMARVTGPRTLAAILTQSRDSASAEFESASEIPAAAIDFAADAVASIARTFVEAGANAILIHEQTPPPSAPEKTPTTFADWAAPFAQTINIVRFYEALPIVILPALDAPTTTALQRASPGWIVCQSLLEQSPGEPAPFDELRGTAFGLAIPPSICDPPAAQAVDARSRIMSLISESHPSIVTTAGEIPPAADIKLLNGIGDAARAKA